MGDVEEGRTGCVVPYGTHIHGFNVLCTHVLGQVPGRRVFLQNMGIIWFVPVSFQAKARQIRNHHAFALREWGA